MKSVTSRHWLCGTEVVEEVADDYDLSEGLALVCPTCKDVWWHYPEAAPVVRPPAAVPPPEPGPVPPARRPQPERRLAPERSPLELSDEELTRRTWPEDRPRPGQPRRAPDEGVRLARGWIAPALVLAGLSLVVLRLVDSGERSTSPPPRVQTASRPAPLASRPPAPASVVTVQGNGFTVQRPREWRAFESSGTTVVAPARRAPIGVYVYSDRRRGLQLERMAALAANTIRAGTPGATVSRPAPVRVDGLDGLRVSSARGGGRRTISVLAGARDRYVIDVRTARDATAEQRRLAGEVAASFRPL